MVHRFVKDELVNNRPEANERGENLQDMKFEIAPMLQIEKAMLVGALDVGIEDAPFLIFKVRLSSRFSIS